MVPFISSVLLLCVAGVVADLPITRTFETGRLIENVPSQSSPGERFTLYLPPGFDPARPTPILYLMDPRGRARVPAKLFLPAAERYGYILISSETMSSDGPMEPSLRAFQAMWDDTRLWFSIDPKRTYLAGFSGTARMASLIAQNTPEAVTGIVGVGAGFHPDVRPSRGTPFLYFGAVGDVDYNFHEVESLEHALASLDRPHRLERFPGPHSWLTPALATQAVEWFELRAMRDGTRPRDAALVAGWWERDDVAARGLMADGRVLDAARLYAAMARDFEDLRETAHVRRAAAAIAAAPPAKAQLERRLADTKRSNWWVSDAMVAIGEAFLEGADAPVIPLHELAEALDVARLKKTAGGQGQDAREARRRLNQIEVQLGFYLPHDALGRLEFARADYYLSLAVQIDDASPVSWYLRAQTHAGLQAPREVIEALRRAIDAGFRNLALVEADASFRRLRGDADFVAVVDLLRCEGDWMDTPTVDRPPAFVIR
jgi:predicted esterase